MIRVVCVLCFFFLMIRRPPRSTLFPYTTLSDLVCPVESDMATVEKDRVSAERSTNTLCGGFLLSVAQTVAPKTHLFTKVLQRNPIDVLHRSGGGSVVRCIPQKGRCELSFSNRGFKWVVIVTHQASRRADMHNSINNSFPG